MKFFDVGMLKQMKNNIIKHNRNYNDTIDKVIDKCKLNTRIQSYKFEFIFFGLVFV